MLQAHNVHVELNEMTCIAKKYNYLYIMNEQMNDYFT